MHLFGKRSLCFIDQPNNPSPTRHTPSQKRARTHTHIETKKNSSKFCAKDMSFSNLDMSFSKIKRL